MCGFAGFLDLDRATSASELSRLAAAMVEPIVHRGPDDGGIHLEAEHGLALGFRRLAIVDLSPAGHQPMRSRDGRCTIVFNGEIYNFAALKAELVALGMGFRGGSDTEVILAGVEAWGFAGTLERLSGMFALALWDRVERRLRLARDRLGKKPLYWSLQARTFLFGSQPKCLFAHPRFRAEIDQGAVSAYLRFGYVPAPASIFAGTRKLMPGTWLEVDADARLTEHRFFDLVATASEAVATPRPMADEQAIDALEALLGDAVAQRMIADVPLGAFLSGGIDSSTVVALMQRRSSRPVRTFAIGFEDRAHDEAAHARAVAQHLGTDHAELRVSGADALAQVPKLASWFDEPFADASAIPSLLLAELTRKSVTVALSGDGGDELMAGYTRYREAARMLGVAARLPCRRLLARGLRSAPAGLWPRLGALLPDRLEPVRLDERVLNLADLLDGSPEHLLRRIISHWPRPEALTGAQGLADAAPWDGSLPQNVRGLPERLQLTEMLTYLPDDILVKIDRATMAYGLEARCPLLDHRVVEFAWRLPSSQRVRGGTSKWLLRQLLYRHVPAALVERPKRGFTPPVAAWLRGPLKGWMHDLLAPGRLKAQGLLDPAMVRRVMDEHLQGRADRRLQLWNLLMLQAWIDTWQGQRSPTATMASGLVAA